MGHLILFLYYSYMYLYVVFHVLQVRDALREHFTSCGEITRISVPRGDEGGLKGFVF